MSDTNVTVEDVGGESGLVIRFNRRGYRTTGGLRPRRRSRWDQPPENMEDEKAPDEEEKSDGDDDEESQEIDYPDEPDNPDDIGDAVDPEWEILAGMLRDQEENLRVESERRIHQAEMDRARQDQYYENPGRHSRHREAGIPPVVPPVPELVPSIPPVVPPPFIGPMPPAEIRHPVVPRQPMVLPQPIGSGSIGPLLANMLGRGTIVIPPRAHIPPFHGSRRARRMAHEVRRMRDAHNNPVQVARPIVDLSYNDDEEEEVDGLDDPDDAEDDAEDDDAEDDDADVVFDRGPDIQNDVPGIYGIHAYQRGIPCPEPCGRDIESKEILVTCSVCHSNQSSTAIFPCMHVCLCDDCAHQLSRVTNVCPICRTGIQHIARVYMCFKRPRPEEDDEDEDDTGASSSSGPPPTKKLKSSAV